MSGAKGKQKKGTKAKPVPKPKVPQPPGRKPGEPDVGEVDEGMRTALTNLGKASKSLDAALKKGWPVEGVPANERPIQRGELERLREEASDVADRLASYRGQFARKFARPDSGTRG